MKTQTPAEVRPWNCNLAVYRASRSAAVSAARPGPDDAHPTLLDDPRDADAADLHAAFARFLRAAGLTCYVLFCLAIIILIGIQICRDFPSH